ncbi:ABC transporter permease [Clostridium swellfunianum]|uniref:ABC transporter permease n=1 Tax=Clostridium swellfunianum TaxID=1367462 RepID=UPI00202DD129|nr:ABC transporter permease [Clostridium swellfunianum]MCM0649483.1 ABC transporter permease [Clostridium swellfunianum]
MRLFSNIVENFKMAIDSILSNKMRSFLTMLGIIIGISSVITIVSLGQGGQNTITGEFEKIGAATINVSLDNSKAEPSDYITLKDIDAIKEKVATVKYISPTVSKNGVAISEVKTKRASITGGNPDLFAAQNAEFLYGRGFNEREFLEGKPVIVIDEVNARALFGYTDAVGKSIKLGSRKSPVKATIIGVTKLDLGGFAFDTSQMPALIYASTNFVKTMYPTDFNIDRLTLVATTKDEGEAAGNGAKNILESRHNNRGKDKYKVENALKQLDQVNKVLGIFTAFIGAVAAISLLVGGIGVMNIMLVSVTERTREIGIRKAIGATTNAILLQFLTESVIISLIGGIIGMILGILGGYAIGSFANITPSLSIGVIIGAILFSSAVGIFFGIYPARKAANLNPIDALRYE